MEEGCGEDDKEEAYREDLKKDVRSLEVSRDHAPEENIRSSVR